MTTHHNDPSRDPVGTIRVHPEDDIWTDYARRLVKLDGAKFSDPDRCWFELTGAQSGGGDPLGSQDVQGWPVQSQAVFGYIMDSYNSDELDEFWEDFESRFFDGVVEAVLEKAGPETLHNTLVDTIGEAAKDSAMTLISHLRADHQRIVADLHEEIRAKTNKLLIAEGVGFEEDLEEDEETEEEVAFKARLRERKKAEEVVCDTDPPTFQTVRSYVRGYLVSLKVDRKEAEKNLVLYSASLACPLADRLRAAFPYLEFEDRMEWCLEGQIRGFIEGEYTGRHQDIEKKTQDIEGTAWQIVRYVVTPESIFTNDGIEYPQD